MRKSTRACQVEPPNELTMPQKSQHLGAGDKCNCEIGVAFTGTIPYGAPALWGTDPR